AQRVVAADRHQVFQPQRADVLEHRAGYVEHLGGGAVLGGLFHGECPTRQNRGQLLHFGWVGARAVQIGAAGAVDGARVLAVQRQNVAHAAGGVFQVDVGQPLPSAADPDHLTADLASAVNHRFDYGIQTWNIAATG